MKIKINPDSLIIEDVTAWELAKIQENCKYLELKDHEKGVRVVGARSRLYMLLYELSYDFDIELY